MSREIKFRAWADQNNNLWPPSMVYWYPVEPPEKYDDKRMSLNNYAWSRHNLMQYTGVQDKNGFDIYEGDIITHSNDGMIGAVCWSEGLYRFVIERGDEIIADLCDYDLGPEIIGNIYENPELLKDTPKE